MSKALQLQVRENRILQQAAEILFRRLRNHPVEVDRNPTGIASYLKMRLSTKPREIFGAIYFDVGMRIIADEQLFLGTTHSCTVHPKEIIREALRYNAVYVAIYHNHPSNYDIQPTIKDRELTAIIKSALETIEVKLVDHIIISGNEFYAFTMNGDL